jgi:hypothetical protein
MPDRRLYHLPRPLALDLRFIRVGDSLVAEVEVAAGLVGHGGDQRTDGCVTVLGVSDRSGSTVPCFLKSRPEVLVGRLVRR